MVWKAEMQLKRFKVYLYIYEQQSRDSRIKTFL